MRFVELDYLSYLRALVLGTGAAMSSWQSGRTKERWRALTVPVTLTHEDRDDGSIPLLQSKRMPPGVLLAELVGFIRGETNERWYSERGCSIWKEWAAEDGALGPIYGAQWRRWDGGDDMPPRDQLLGLVTALRRQGNDRRGLVSAWNVADIKRMALPPCHFAFQAIVLDGRLNLTAFMRSGDWFLGVPFNLASYAVLMHLLAREVGVAPGRVSLVVNNPHIYENHLDAARAQLAVAYGEADCPTLNVADGVSIFNHDFDVAAVRIVGYKPHGPRIPAPVAV